MILEQCVKAQLCRVSNTMLRNLRLFSSQWREPHGRLSSQQPRGGAEKQSGHREGAWLGSFYRCPGLRFWGLSQDPPRRWWGAPGAAFERALDDGTIGPGVERTKEVKEGEMLRMS